MVLTAWSTADVVDRLTVLLDAVPAPAAGPLVVAVDGRSGTGKTDLAAALVDRTGAAVVHMDDLYPGWNGLAAAVELLGAVLDRVRTGLPATYPVWDWERGAHTRSRVLPTGGLLVVEGVGAGCARPVDLLVQLDADPAVRRARALGRDGRTFAPHWDDWARQEAQLFADDPLRPDVALRSQTAPGHRPVWTVC